MQKCQSNSYIPIDPLHVADPPLRTQAPAIIKTNQRGRQGGDSRCAPKLPTSATVSPPNPDFIDDKEHKEAPGPSDYNPVLTKAGKTSNSRLHSSILGWAGLMKKSPRFEPSLNGKDSSTQLATLDPLPTPPR